MLVGLSHSVDGLITDKPDLARESYRATCAGLSEPQRFLVAMLIGMGASAEQLEAEDSLRP